MISSQPHVFPEVSEEFFKKAKKITIVMPLRLILKNYREKMENPSQNL